MATTVNVAIFIVDGTGGGFEFVAEKWQAGSILGEEGDAGHAGKDVGVDGRAGDGRGWGGSGARVGGIDDGVEVGQCFPAGVVEGGNEEDGGGGSEGGQDRESHDDSEEAMGKEVLGSAGEDEVGALGGSGGEGWHDVEDESGLLVWLKGVYGDEKQAGEEESPGGRGGGWMCRGERDEEGWDQGVEEESRKSG